jgi:cystathionine beta-lyase
MADVIDGGGFEECPDRRPTCTYSYDRYGHDVLPFWVADCDVLSPAAVRAALTSRVTHGVFGYTHAGPALKQTVVDWMRRRHGWLIDPEWVSFIPGIVCGINVFVRTFAPGAAHIVNTPAYPPFLSAPANHKHQSQHLITVPLAQEEAADGTWRWTIDFEALEKAVVSSVPDQQGSRRAASFILCHPHNPTGREWTVAELERIAEFCRRHDLVVLSDEIWADLVLDGKHVPFLKACPAMADRTVVLMAPSKTFNVAGLGCSVAIIPDQKLREAYGAAEAGIVPHVNLLGLAACEAAWGGECDKWLDDGLLPHIRANRKLLEKTLTRLPRLRYIRPEATYLGWIDARNALPKGVTAEGLAKWLMEKYKIGLGDGTEFGAPGFLRFTLGVPTKMLTEGLLRFEAAFNDSAK